MGATEHDDIGLDDAYSLRTPDDSRRLYARWAATYDEGFVEPTGYVYHRNVAQLFVEAGGSVNGRTLDIGCGTGVVGMALAELGISGVDGVDISPEMLAAAGSKRTDAGAAVYGELFEADLTRAVPVPDGRYGGVISAGTFTHGHLGPEPITELLRLASPGALFALGINRDHYRGLGFGNWFDARLESGDLAELRTEDVPIYAELDGPHAADRSTVVIFRKPPVS